MYICIYTSWGILVDLGWSGADFEGDLGGLWGNLGGKYCNGDGPRRRCGSWTAGVDLEWPERILAALGWILWDLAGSWGILCRFRRDLGGSWEILVESSGDDPP